MCENSDLPVTSRVYMNVHTFASCRSNSDQNCFSFHGLQQFHIKHAKNVYHQFLVELLQQVKGII